MVYVDSFDCQHRWCRRIGLTEPDINDGVNDEQDREVIMDVVKYGEEQYVVENRFLSIPAIAILTAFNILIFGLCVMLSTNSPQPLKNNLWCIVRRRWEPRKASTC